ncbi:MAG TPA: substrate-binding domain-containing protein [Burkholderiales bacterium]|nr:substrate-binding domain-containing protein [Burkholderiales bacterium]
MAVHVDFSLSWLGSRGFAPGRAATTLRLVEAVAKSGSLKQAARVLGVSYRHAWGLLGEADKAFGAPLVELQRGRGARPTPLGEKLLWADSLIRDALDPQFAKLRHDVELELAKALPQRLPRLIVHASHDLALAELPGACTGNLDLELAFRGADECLAALANGKCDVAGFHVADALPRAAAAAAALGRWLDPRKHALIHFIAREQGLIATPDSHIRSVHDLTRPGVRFIHRQGAGAGAASPNVESVAAAVAAGRADAGFGLRADAMRYRLDFVPLAVERYFLAFPRAALKTPGMQAFLEVLKGREFAERVGRLPGYDAAKAGTRAGLDAALDWVKRRGAARVAA